MVASNLADNLSITKRTRSMFSCSASGIHLCSAANLSKTSGMNVLRLATSSLTLRGCQIRSTKLSTYHSGSRIFDATSSMSLRRVIKRRFQGTSARKKSSNQDLFISTRYRYVSNEAEELSQRYVEFDVEELQKLAAKSVGSLKCVAMSKGVDGSFNRILNLQMDDGKEVIAKISTPNAGPPHLTTASEVATMEFVRSVLAIPVPRVYAWSSKTAGNPVGAEYIIMEKITGVPLSAVWDFASVADRIELVKKFAEFQKSLMSASFKRYGSLYFAADLEGRSPPEPLYTNQDGKEIFDSRFAIGPTVGREWLQDGRSKVEFNRGPWNTVLEYKTAVGLREIACIEQLPQLPKSWVSLYGPGTYIPTREKKLGAMRMYLKLLKYLLPEDRLLNAATLWHADSHSENIFVNPQNPKEIIGVIDWQSTEIAPLFEFARPPGFLDHDGPSTEAFERPQKPVDFESLDLDTKQKAQKLWIDQSLEAIYRLLILNTNKQLHNALEFCKTPAEDLLLLARHILVDGEAYYIVAIDELHSQWSDLPAVKVSSEPPPFPFEFSKEELDEMHRDATHAVKAVDAMIALKDTLGSDFPDRGAVLPENYERIKKLLKEVKEEFLKNDAHNDHDRALLEENWPFDD